MALTKITSRILDSSGVTILGTIATGVWQGTAINQTYLVGQSGTNTGDETLARINALDVTELGTVSSGVWNGTAIASAYLDADTAHLSTTQTFTGAKTFSSAVLIQQSGSTGFVTEKTGGTGSFINLKDNAGTVFIGGVNNEFVVQTSGSSYSNKLTISNAGNATFSGSIALGGATIANSYLLEITAASGNIMRSTRGSSQFSMYQANNGGVFLGTTGNNDLRIIQNDGDALIIDTNKRVGIGTTSPTTKLHIRGTSASIDSTLQIVGNGVSTLLLGQNARGGVIRGQGGSNELAFLVGGSGDAAANAGGTEAMRITSVGKLIVASPNSEFKGLFENTNTTGGQHCYFDIKSNGQSNGLAILRLMANGTTCEIHNENNQLKFKTNGTQRLNIANDGKLYYAFTSSGGSVNDVTFNPSTNEVYYISSSRKYKENIEDYSKSTLDNILKLKVKTFDYINGNGIDQVGLIAEEVNEHIPELVPKIEVEGFDEPQPDSVRYSQLSVFLLKAIQEQQTIIEDLKSRIEIIEG